MRNKVYILLALTLMHFVAPIAALARTTEDYRGHQIQAAFLYNFIKFVDLPEEKIGDANKPIIIGIIGEDDFSNIFEAPKNKLVKGREVVIKQFKDLAKQQKYGKKRKAELDNQKIEALRKCHLLFIHSAQEDNLREIIKALNGSSVLTVGETADFLEAGGILNFLMQDKKVRFEINITAAERNKLKIRSKLLRLAKRVIKEKPSDKD